ncbi:MAG: hypothetical protein HQL54_14500 [Magnetococcales bacterium]|nr:hypothetical protein [Magnetococcales bacterium]
MMALIFLAVMTASLTAAGEGLSSLSIVMIGEPLFNWPELLSSLKEAPMSPDNAWMTIMVWTTLIPTALHFMAMVAGTATISLPNKWHRWAKQILIEEQQSNREKILRINQINLSLYFTARWSIGVVAFLGVGLPLVYGAYMFFSYFIFSDQSALFVIMEFTLNLMGVTLPDEVSDQIRLLEV